VLALLAALATVQVGSDAIFANAAAPYSFPAALAPQNGEVIYSAIAGVAPAAYVNDMLARAALQRGDLAAAQRYVLRLPASAARSEWLARLAQVRGDERASLEHFIDAGDVFAIDRLVRQLAPRDPAAAYALETKLKNRLEQGGTHPDAVAEAYWRLGVIAAQQHRQALALANYRHAVGLSPIAGKYLLSAGFQAYDLHLMLEAQHDFARAIGVDPASADAYAGAGLVALSLGNRAAAQAYAAQSRALDARARALQTLQTQLQ
jgi:hypothetical protein